MNRSKFVDTIEILVNAGNGGSGKVSFRREKYVPKGGPDGGDGGDGGNVIIKADNNMSTLMDFRSKPKYAAQDGEGGSYRQRKGENGGDLVLKVPEGTLIYQLGGEDKVLVGDMVDGKEMLIAAGGLGGRGNESFKSSRNRTPMQFTPGTKGEEKKLFLEIKLVADIGLIGLPNAGKSTLINQLAGTKAKVANYPFTTLNPNLGVCLLPNGKETILADIPGLIEGASEGKGLGDEFLRHVERTRILVHLVDPYTEDNKDFVERAQSLYKTIRKELETYGNELSNKKEIVVINKIDITEVKEQFEAISEAFKGSGVEVLGISALTGEGKKELLSKIMNVLGDLPKEKTEELRETVKVYTINDLPNKRIVFRH